MVMPVLMELVEDVPELPPGHGVHPEGGFVQKEHLGPVDQRAHQSQLLAHAAGKIGGEPAGKGRQPRELQELRHAACPGVAVHPVQVGVKGDIFHDRQVAVEAEALGHVADVLPDLVALAHRVKPQDCRPPLVRVHDPHQEPHHRGLAGAVRAHQGEGLPQGHRQAQVVHRQPRLRTAW